MAAESDHTPPSKWCPHPDLWHAPDGWATEAEVAHLLAALVRVTRPQLVVETGTYLGHTAYEIGRELRFAGRGHLDTIEVDRERAEAARQLVDGLPVTVYSCSSMEYRPAQPIDLLFCDSDPATRPREIERLWSWIAPGALIAVHDTAPHHGADIEALTRGLGHVNLRTPRGLLIFQKE